MHRRSGSPRGSGPRPPGDAFEIVEVAPGVAQFIVSLCDYRDNPWGDYNEVNLGFLARPSGAGAEVIGSFIYRMPVDQAFTCEAGNRVMGSPKTVMRIDADDTDDTLTFELWHEGTLALRVRVPRAAIAGLADQPRLLQLGGEPHRDLRCRWRSTPTTRTSCVAHVRQG